MNLSLAICKADDFYQQKDLAIMGKQIPKNIESDVVVSLFDQNLRRNIDQGRVNTKMIPRFVRRKRLNVENDARRKTKR